MKYELNENQVFFIEKKISELGLTYLPLREEFLDHICCSIEEEMINGLNFQQAIHVVFEAIGKDELQELQEQTIFLINQKSRHMRNAVFIFTSALVLLVGSFFFFKKEKNDLSIQPPTPQEVESSKHQELVCNHYFYEEKKLEHDPPNVHPLKGDGHITSNYGMRFHPVFKKKQFHKGMDFKAPTGTPVIATSNGEVVEVKIHGKGYGKHIVVKHDDRYKTLYVHLNDIKVTKGQKVNIGNVIGTVGSSGFSTEPHLHYEVIKDGKAVDPIAYCNP